ncbi:retrovirus-related pol polyprotein from transposon TNT 1-94 [Tanacetum coccineum]
MANLSSTSATNNPVNEVHSNDNQIFDNVDYQIQEMHQEEHLDSDAETEIDDNTISVIIISSDTEAQNVPTEVPPEGSCDQQALETDRIQLKDTITSLRIQLDGLKVENVSLKRRYDELSQANTHSRTAYTEKLSALTAGNNQLKAQVTGKTSSGPSTSETPKVLAPGIEPPRPSLKPTQKPVVHPNKQTNVCVPMSTGVKPTSGASKTVPKRAPRNHSSLPIKSANARRVEAHHRTLNKKNRVDSNLLVKHSVSVSNLNNVCGACNKSLVFANHNDCLVMCDDSVNVKPHQTKRFKRQPKKEWKPIKNVGKPNKKTQHNLYSLVDSFGDGRFRSCISTAFMSHPQLLIDGIYSKVTDNQPYSILQNDMMSASPVLLAYKSLSTKFLRTKDETPQVIEKFIMKTQRALNATVRFVRTDNGTEFVNKTLDGWLRGLVFNHETSVPRSPQQNGVVERRNRTLMEAARTMLIFAKAPLFLWAEAVATACYTLNRSLVHTLHGKTYYELLKGKKPNLQYFRVFGSLCYPTNDYDDVGKLKAKADIGIFVGYAPTKKAYRIYNKRTRKIQETVHVAFDELTEGLTSVQTSSGLEPHQMTSVPNSTELELHNCFNS